MYLKYVNTKIGTLNDNRFSHGNLYPIIARPNGLVAFSVQTKAHGDRWWYHPNDKSFEGIRLTHQPSPWIGDYGHMLFLPHSGDYKTSNEQRWSHFRNDKEVLTPVELKGFLSQYLIDYSLTPSSSGAVMQFKFHKNDKKSLSIIGMNGTINMWLVDNQTLKLSTDAKVEEANPKIIEYLYLKTSVPFEIEKQENAYTLIFESNFVELKLATSFVSFEQAIINYYRELDNKTYNQIKEEGVQIWESRLSKIEIVDDDEDLKKLFYSAFYRTMLFPRQFHEFDENGKPHHLSANLGVIKEGLSYTDNGFWDTFRTLYPLLSIIEPKLYKDILDGYVNYFNENGYFPKWICPNEKKIMTGTLCEVTMSEGIVKGFYNETEGQEIVKMLIKNAEVEDNSGVFGRKIPKTYRKLGYLPFDKVSSSLSETLDYYYGDYSIGLAAQKVGLTDVSKKYLDFSYNYKHLFSKKDGFLRSKDSNGLFRLSFNPFDWGNDYVEGGPWQCGFSVFHDIKGLDKVYDYKLEDKIDELLATEPIYNVGGYGNEIHEMSEMASLGFGQLALSNQPSFHIPFIYSELGKIEKTNTLVKKLINKLFKSDVDGYPGDEDNGSMSAWVIFSLLGFYPFNPSSGIYTLSGPLVNKAIVHLEDGDLVIEKDTINLNKAKTHFSHETLIKAKNLKDIV